MVRRCVALLSGGLDSMLAVRTMQLQGLVVEALNFKTLFTCCQDQSAQAARELGVRLTVLSPEEDYLDLIQRPRFGYGKGANPCVDCRIYMFEKANRFREQVGADFLVSGEVIGQRPMSQKRRDFEVIAHHASVADLLLRPLSARCLPATRPEREGWVDRERLYGFTGRSRKGLIELARRLGLPRIPAPSNGCALTEPGFSQKVFDLFDLQPSARDWDYELLQVGRHFRFDDQTKVVVGRNQADNQRLGNLHSRSDASSTGILEPSGCHGPTALLVGRPSRPALEFAAGLVLRYSGAECSSPSSRSPFAVGCLLKGGESLLLTPELTDRVRAARTISDGSRARLTRSPGVTRQDS